MATHTVTVGYAGGDIQETRSITLTGTGVSQLDAEPFVASANDQGPFTFALDNSTLVGYYLYSDVTVTIETNSSSVADDSFVLTGGIPEIYTGAAGQTNLFSSADVTVVYVSNAVATAGSLTMIALFDGSP